MSTTATRRSLAHRTPAPVRLAQVLLALPLGLLQLSAAVGFSATGSVNGLLDWLVAGWAVAMSAIDIVVAALLGRRAVRLQVTALGLLGAQLAFAAVKLVVYHESASLVFAAITLSAAALLVVPPSRRHFAA